MTLFVDRTRWQPGEWDHEPDREEWRDTATGLPCLAVRGRLGNWCGYVGVAPDHRWYGWGYDNVPLECHGGLTFADKCHPDPARGGGICHTAGPGEAEDVWWFGFDCAHAGDIVPGMLEDSIDYDPPFSYTYKNLAYVKEEVADLAQQLT